eukprot:6791048-Prorocentrum_lima.AAC.1
MKEEASADTLESGEAEPGTSKSGEAGPSIKERDKLEEDQLLKVLHETSMLVLENQVAQVGIWLASEMEEHIRNVHIPKRMPHLRTSPRTSCQTSSTSNNVRT